ncbi:fungal hydrophobin-domain-containing protein [Cyathus striatus]|nr:fungal hydrophobin-domain-containing protein [Cyathus striatus]
MFSKISLLITAAVAASTLAIPTPGYGSASQCNTGNLQCCQHVQDSKDPSVTGLLGLLGVAVQGITAQVGLDCSPISVIGIASGASCTAQPVCCENNNFSGLVALGCNPVNLNL